MLPQLLLTLSLSLPFLPLSLASTHNNHRNKRHQNAVNNFEIAKRDLPQPEYTNNTLLKRDSYTGTGTYFFVGLGACGLNSQDSDLMVALNYQQYGSGYPGPECFKYITVEANGITVGGVEILDECPSCPDVGDLDMSPGLFEHFAQTQVGTLAITWWFDDGSGGTTTSTTPTLTYVAPTSTWSPSPSTQAYTPTTTSTSTWSPSPSPSTWQQATSTSTYVAPTSSSNSPSSTSAAPSSTITSSSWSSDQSSSSSIKSSANPFAVISSDSASESASATSSSATGSSGNGSSGVTAGAASNLIALNGLVANYGNIVVQAAAAA